jgi:caspase-like apoptosis-related cysteine protease
VFFLSTAANKTDHTDADCIVIIVLTHRNKNGTLHTKDRAYSIQELWMPFAADKCPSLAGKPKLFFIEVNTMSDKLLFSSLSL